VLIGSADLMPRNLDHRVEVLCPIQHPRWRESIINDILGSGMQDNMQGKRLRADGTYERVQLDETAQAINSQEWLLNHWKLA